MSEYSILDFTNDPNVSANPWARLGECLIDQRNPTGAAHAIVAGAAAAYTLDGWLASCTGANVSVAQSSVLSGEFQKQIVVTGALGNTGANLVVRAEDTDVTPFASSISTVSVWAKSTPGMVVNWSASYANAVNNFGAVTQIASGQFITDGTLRNYWFRIPANAGTANGLQITFSVAALGAGQSLTLTGLDQCQGNVLRPYPHAPEGSVLLLCQRYLPAFNSSSTGDFFAVGGSATATTAYCEFLFMVQPFTIPTGIVISNIANFGASEPGLNATILSGLAINSIGLRAALLQGTVAAAVFTPGRANTLYGAAVGAQLLFTGCEL